MDFRTPFGTLGMWQLTDPPVRHVAKPAAEGILWMAENVGAGQRQNWPLAQFYLDETRSHLKWAVRIIPVRKDPAGQDVDLTALRRFLDRVARQGS